MLTFGEGGVVIEWDLAQATERRRFAALGEPIVSVRVHPHDPWAVVIAGWRPSHAYRLDLGSGRCTRLWEEPVQVVAFDATGARAAVIFHDPDRGSRLAVYAEAALRAAHPPAPDLEHAFPGRWPDRVFFHPHGDAVFAGSYRETTRIPLDGTAAKPATDYLFGFLADGTEVVEMSDRYRPTAAGPFWLAGGQTLERGGAAAGVWKIEGSFGTPAIAADGTVVAPDGHGRLHLFGIPSGKHRTVDGQPGAALQLCFDASGSHLAIGGGCVLSLLDVASGAVTRIDGTFTIHALPEPGAFALLDGKTVRTIRAAELWRPAIAAQLPGGVTATTFEREWTGDALVRPFRWLPGARQLWLGDAIPEPGDAGPARVVGGTLVMLPDPRRVDEYGRGIALHAGRNGDVVLATATGPVQCSVTRRSLRWWSSLRTFDRAGKLRCARPLPYDIAWMRASPAGALVAVPGRDDKVCVYASNDLHPIHEVTLGFGEIVAWEFVDERSALASNGEALLLVQVAAGVTKRIAAALPGPITQFCLSPDRRLVAVACGSDVRVLRRQ